MQINMNTSLSTIQNPKFLGSLKAEQLTEEICWLAVRHHGCALRWVPQELITQEMCLAAIYENSYAIEFVPEHLLTEEMCWLVAEHLSYALEYVPEHFKSKQLCEAAVKSCASSLEWVPEQFKTEQLCDLAIRSGSGSLPHTPKEFRTPGLYLKAIQYFDSLESIPEDMQSYALCLAAISRLGKNIEFVPKEIIDELMCFIAVKDDKSNLQFVPQALISESLVYFAFFAEASDFINSSVSLNTIDLYRDYAQFLKGVDSNYLSKLANFPELYITVPIALKTKSFQYAAIFLQTDTFKYMAESEKTIEISSIALNACGNLLRYVPEQLKTLELCKLALRDEKFYRTDVVPRKFWQELNISKEWPAHQPNVIRLIENAQFICQ